MHLLEYADKFESLASIARKVGKTRGTVTKWAYGRTNPTPENWRDIVRATNGLVTPNDHIIGIGLTDRQRSALSRHHDTEAA